MIKYQKFSIISFCVLSFVLYSAMSFGQSLASENIPTAPMDEDVPPLPTYEHLHNVPTSTKLNYVRHNEYNIPTSTRTSSHTSITTEYYDGLVRPIQKVQKHCGVNGTSRYDLVQPIVYDDYGKSSITYLPYAREVPTLWAGGMVKDVHTAYTEAYPLSSGDHPYSKVNIEKSPLNRLEKQMGEGKSWVGSDRGVQYIYGTNSKMIRSGKEYKGIYPRFHIGSSPTDLPLYQGDYAYGQLRMVRSIDEDNRWMETFTDKSGKIVFTRVLKVEGGVVNLATPFSYEYTIYVYDQIGRLRFVASPKAAQAIELSVTATEVIHTWDFSTEVAENLCYQYFYDGRGRMIEKQVPGKAREKFVYDQRDRLVLSQNGNLESDEWLFSFFDGLNRPTWQGKMTDAEDSRTAMQTILDNATSYPSSHWAYWAKNYDLQNPYPTSAITNTTPYVFQYYDDYNRVEPTLAFEPSFLSEVAGAPATVHVFDQALNTRFKPTGTKIAILKDEMETDIPDWLYAATYYDAKGRIIQSKSTNIKNGIDTRSTLYYFKGLPWKVIQKHTNPSAEALPGASDVLDEIVITDVYTRHITSSGGHGMITHHTRKIDDGPTYDYARHSYDHFGRLVLSVFPAFNNTYKYNRRGWLTEISYKEPMPEGGGPIKHFFTEKLYYDQGFNTKYYNGNIAGVRWTNFHSGTELTYKEHAYGYTYDMLNRLSHAEYRYNNVASISPDWSKTALDYTVSGITYDPNGNILSMTQRGVTPSGVLDMDILSYGYAAHSNRLIHVEDAVPPSATSMLPDFKNNSSLPTEYTYDANGNLKTDANKGISLIEYTIHDKPSSIVVSDEGSISYVYDALGNKLRKTVIPTEGTPSVHEYIADLVYEDGKLSFIHTPDGRMRPRVGTDELTRWVYDYYTKDHLGNVRATVTAEPLSMAYLARHEIASAYIENLFFDNIPPVRVSKPGGGGDDDYAIRLNAQDSSRRTGTSLMLRVMPGDRFDVQVEALYHDTAHSQEHLGGEQMLESLLSTLMGGSTYAGVPLAELPDNLKHVQQALGQPGLGAALEDIYTDALSSTPGIPRAFLTYLYFDQQFRLDAAHSGALPLGGAGSWHTIEASDIFIPASGYLFIFVNSSEVGRDVWFDDLHVGHYSGQVLDEHHYYPFGLCISNEAAGITPQPYKYNGKELERKFGLEWYSYGAREYDPQLGRFPTVDPLADADKNIGYSPYSYAINNPISYIDPDGRCWQKVGESYVPCDDASVGSTTTGAFGHSWTMTKNDGWQLTNGADPSKVNYQYDHIEPTGDKSYYVDRYKNHIEKYNTRPPDYYLEYGYNNKALFDKVYPSMSDVGKEVFNEIGPGLQNAMNEGIRNNPSLQGSNQEFKDFAYKSHFPVYKKSGIGRLGGDDLLRMISAPKWRDTFGSLEGLSLIKNLFPILFSERPRNPDLWDPQKNPGLIQPGESKL